MTLVQVPSPRGATAERIVGPLRARHLVPIAVVVAASALTFGLTVVATFLANGLDTAPRAGLVGGAFDPEDLALAPTATAQLLGFLAIALTPAAAGIGALLTGVDLVESLRARRPRAALVPGAAVLVLCLGVLVWYASSGTLVTWWTD